MSRPSDGMTLDELRDEFDWMFEFQSRMAERIRDDEDVHNLVDYVTKLEAENAKLRKIAREQRTCILYGNECDGCPHRIPAGGCDATFRNEYNNIRVGEEEDNNG